MDLQIGANLLGIPTKQAYLFCNSGSVAMVRLVWLARPWLYQFLRAGSKNGVAWILTYPCVME